MVFFSISTIGSIELLEGGCFIDGGDDDCVEVMGVVLIVYFCEGGSPDLFKSFAILMHAFVVLFP